jgi:hypothetical protein
MGQLFETFAPSSISNNGLVCQAYDDKTIDTSVDKQLVIPPGLRVELRTFTKTADILKSCTDPNVLYNFGNSNGANGFDSYNPPNNFFQIISTLPSAGDRPLNYSTFAFCCVELCNLPVNIIRVIPKGQEKNWKSPPSFTAEDDEVAKEISLHKMEKLETTETRQFQFNDDCALSILPSRTREALSRVKFFRGVVDITKRKFSHSATQRIPRCRLLNIRQTTTSLNLIFGGVIHFLK